MTCCYTGLYNINNVVPVNQTHSKMIETLVLESKECRNGEYDIKEGLIPSLISQLNYKYKFFVCFESHFVVFCLFFRMYIITLLLHKKDNRIHTNHCIVYDHSNHQQQPNSSNKNKRSQLSQIYSEVMLRTLVYKYIFFLY